MKRNRLFLKSAVVAFAMGAVVLAPLSTFAITLQERDEQAVQDYRDARTTYRNEVEKYATARNKFQNSRDAYRNNRTDQKLEVAMADAKAFLLQTTDSSISYLDMLRTKVESMSGISEADRTATLNEIDEDITFLRNKRVEVQNATTREQLTTLGSDIRTRWDEIRADTKRIVGNVLAARINYILGEMTTLSVTVDAKIAILADQGANVFELNRLNNSFQANLSLAQTAYENAKGKFSAIQNIADANALFNDGREFVEDANKALRDAHADLKEIVKEIKKTPIRSTDVEGTGVLNATGSGTATLDGNGTVKGTVDSGGRVTITDNAGDVQVTGGGGNRETLADGRIQYTALTGEITITGTDIIVEVVGSNIEFEATGTGTVTLKGDGTYTTDNSTVKRTFSATPIQIQIAK